MNLTLQPGGNSLRNVSKEQGVYELLRGAIATGHIKPGHRLISAEIGDALGVSAMPVRNALMRLEAEGLVIRVPHREFVVRPYSSKSIRELYAVRAVLDGYAARLGAECMTSEALEELRNILSRAEELLRGAAHRAALKAVNREFHVVLYRCAGNEQLIDVIEMLRDRSMAYIDAYYAMPWVVAHCIEEHRHVITALEQGRPDLVESLVRKDMEGTGEVLLRMVKDQEEILASPHPLSLPEDTGDLLSRYIQGLSGR